MTLKPIKGEQKLSLICKLKATFLRSKLSLEAVAAVVTKVVSAKLFRNYKPLQVASTLLRWLKQLMCLLVVLCHKGRKGCSRDRKRQRQSSCI